jgi:DNA-binding GntR family transcriptional regulator
MAEKSPETGTAAIPKSSKRPRRNADIGEDLESIGSRIGSRGTADLVVERIREAILSGGLAPGTRLRETHLASRLGVSRIPVREALARLVADGLVEHAPYKGARVVLLTLDQVIESFMLRSLLEGFAAKLATPNMTSEEIGRLRTLIGQLEECGRTDRLEDTPALHREIHAMIYSRCGSAKLLHWIGELDNRFPRSLKRSYRFDDQPQEYRRIVDAIEAGEAELAGRLMGEHIEGGGRVIIRLYAEKLPEGGSLPA